MLAGWGKLNSAAIINSDVGFHVRVRGYNQSCAHSVRRTSSADTLRIRHRVSALTGSRSERASRGVGESLKEGWCQGQRHLHKDCTKSRPYTQAWVRLPQTELFCVMLSEWWTALRVLLWSGAFDVGSAFHRAFLLGPLDVQTIPVSLSTSLGDIRAWNRTELNLKVIISRS